MYSFNCRDILTLQSKLTSAKVNIARNNMRRVTTLSVLHRVVEEAFWRTVLPLCAFMLYMSVMLVLGLGREGQNPSPWPWP